MGVERFRKVYNKIPGAEHKFTIVIIDGKEINWDIAKNEIENNTELGNKIEKKLIELEII